VLAKGVHWRVSYTTHPASDDRIDKRLHEQATFVLIRTRSPDWRITDEEMISRYKQQYRVEQGFAWLKSTADINPAFLHTPHRIAALCFIYCLGLMIWNITQRTVRKNLKEWGQGLPYHRNNPSSNITTRFLYELFPTVVSQSIRVDGAHAETRLVGFTEVHALACRALGMNPKAYQPVR
jgi:transposase